MLEEEKKGEKDMAAIQCYKTGEASKIICVERHLIKYLRENGLLTGRKQGNGWVFDELELTEFVVKSRGYDLSNAEKIRFYAPIIRKMYEVRK